MQPCTAVQSRAGCQAASLNAVTAKVGDLSEEEASENMMTILFMALNFSGMEWAAGNLRRAYA